MGVLSPLVRAVFPALADFALPKRCLACGTLAPDGGRSLCGDCLARVSAVPEPACARCALPISRPAPPSSRRGRRRAICPACRTKPPPFQRTVAGAAYEGTVRELVLAMKFGRDRLAALPLADLAIDALGRTPGALAARAGAVVVVPMPLSARRRRERGFNQADLIARRVARAFGWPLRAGLLSRIRDTPPQSLAPTRSARREILRGVFLARVRRAERFSRVVLVDDVMTTGATAEAAARALRSAGCAEVTVVVAGRAL